MKLPITDQERLQAIKNEITDAVITKDGIELDATEYNLIRLFHAGIMYGMEVSFKEYKSLLDSFKKI